MASSRNGNLMITASPGVWKSGISGPTTTQLSFRVCAEARINLTEMKATHVLNPESLCVLMTMMPMMKRFNNRGETEVKAEACATGGRMFSVLWTGYRGNPESADHVSSPIHGNSTFTNQRANRTHLLRTHRRRQRSIHRDRRPLKRHWSLNLFCFKSRSGHIWSGYCMQKRNNTRP